MNSEHLLRYLERRVWPRLAYSRARGAAAARWLFLRVFWAVQRDVLATRRREAAALLRASNAKGAAAAQQVAKFKLLAVEARARATLRATRERLWGGLGRLIAAENRVERLRRAANVADWALQGLVNSPAVAREVARYEARHGATLGRLWPSLALPAHAIRVHPQ